MCEREAEGGRRRQEERTGVGGGSRHALPVAWTHRHTTLAGKDPARPLQVASYLQAERCLKILLAVW